MRFIESKVLDPLEAHVLQLTGELVRGKIA